MSPKPLLILLGISVLSWLLSLYLLYKLWRNADLLTIKIGLSVLLLVPVAGPLAFFWIQAFPELPHPDLQDQGQGPLSAQTLLYYKYRNLFEAAGKLPPLVQHFKRRRRK
jgi:hypothetical protein